MSSLLDRLSALLGEGGSYSYAKLVGSQLDHAGSAREVQNWIAWVQRVQTLIRANFKVGSAPLALLEKGEAEVDFNTPREFEFTWKSFMTALNKGIETSSNDLYGESRGATALAGLTFASKKVFVVHGLDHSSKTELELFLKQLGLEPVVLHRQPDEGQTLIEKFEKHSEVGFALVLVTKDDEFANSKVGKAEFRARQNVILEWGYFLGRLGRTRVCCLFQKGVTLPSDLQGLVYKPFRDHIEEAKFALMQELKAAGYELSI